ncbi:MAG: diguanylate cyclase [Thermodesulfobacteriota bacterium]
MENNLQLLYSIIGYPLLCFGVLEAWLGSLLLRRPAKRTNLHVSAATMAFSSALFCLSTGLAYALASWEISGLIYQLAYRSTWSGWFVAVASLQLVFYIDDPESRAAKWAGWILWPPWIISYIVVLTTDFFGAHATSLIPCVAETSPMEIPARIAGGAIIGLALIKCTLTLLHSSGFKRLRLSFFLTGLLLFGLTGFFIAAGFQLMGISAFDPALASFGSIPWVLFTFYAITKYRLFDIKTAFLRILAILTIIAAAAMLHLGFYTLLTSVIPHGWALVVSFTALAVLFVMILPVPAPLERLLTFVSSGKDYHRLLTETARAMISILDLQELLAYLASSVNKYLRAAPVVLLLPDANRTWRLYHGLGLHRRQQDFPIIRFLADRLEQTRSAVFPMAEKDYMPPEQFRAMEKELNALECHMAVPIQYRNRLTGILALGEKSHGKAFTKQDIDALETLAGQAAVALENAYLYDLATRDSMTGLYHHAHFRDRLAEEINRCRRYNSDLTLIFIDIDFFKQFNDTHGHLLGDEIIKAVAKTIAAQVRKSDIVARYGGEEFAVILPETDPAAGLRFAQRLRKTIEDTPVAGHRVTVSLGISALHEKDRSVEALIEKTDHAMYSAKQQGRNRVCEAGISD